MHKPPAPSDTLLGDFGAFHEPVSNGGGHGGGGQQAQSQAQGDDIFGIFDVGSNPTSPVKAPQQTSMHDSVDSFSMFMTGMSGDASQPAQAEQGSKQKKNSQSLDDQMGAAFNAPSFGGGHEAEHKVSSVASPPRSPNMTSMSEEDKVRAATMKLSAKAQARADEEAARNLAAREADEKAAQREQQERLHWKEVHDAKLREWEFDNTVRRNIRVLIQHLPDVLPSELKWKPIPLSKLLNDSQLKKGYFKAVRVVHPDKCQQRGDSIETQVICDFVFQALEMAFKTKFV